MEDMSPVEVNQRPIVSASYGMTLIKIMNGLYRKYKMFLAFDII